MSIGEWDNEEEIQGREREREREREITSMESTIPYLPDSIVIDIFSRLPVKSLIRFKSACKRWFNLISTRHFVKTHITRSQQHKKLAILEPRCPPSAITLRLIDFESNSDDHHPSIELHNSFKYAYPDAKILCSYDGLLIVSISEKTLFVWNPSTREYRHVKMPYFVSSKVHTIAGIGYDSLVDEYKLVLAYQVTGGDCNQTLANCVSLEARYSREVKALFPYRILTDSSATVVDGYPHWIVTRETVNFSVVICYDIMEDIFIELEQPDCIFDDSLPTTTTTFGLGVLRGLLCLFCHKTHHVEVWALDRSDVIESWYNFFVIQNNPVTLSFSYLKPLSFTESGDVLLEINRNKLVVYNLEKGTWRLVEHHQNYNGFKVAMYVESIVSPHDDNGPGHKKNTYIPTKELPLHIVPRLIQRKELP